jgi:glutathione synthase
MKLLWICDPWHRINNSKETTLRLIEEADKLGHKNWFCYYLNIQYREWKLALKASYISTNFKEDDRGFFLDFTEEYPINFFDFIFFRADPPFSIAYINKLQQILVEIKKKPSVSKLVNPPLALLTINSKSICNYFEKFTPTTLITSRWNVIKDFCRNKDKVIIKPLHKGNGKGVIVLSQKSPKSIKKNHLILKKATKNFSECIVMQNFLNATLSKEIRIWFSNGEVVAVGKKTITSKSYSFNIRKGDFIEEYQLTSKEKKITKKISQFLNHENIGLAAIDLIDGKIIDFNISSPGLLREFEIAFKKNLARKVLQNILRTKAKY